MVIHKEDSDLCANNVIGNSSENLKNTLLKPSHFLIPNMFLIICGRS